MREDVSVRIPGAQPLPNDNEVEAEQSDEGIDVSIPVQFTNVDGKADWGNVAIRLDYEREQLIVERPDAEVTWFE